MQLTQHQIAQMQAQGLDMPTIENMARQRGYTMPDNRDVLEKVGSVVNKIFPGKQVGQAIGTLGAYSFARQKEKFGGLPRGTAENVDLSAPTPLQVGGDVLQGAAMVAGARLPGATSILGKTAQFGALGAASGAGSAIAEGKSTMDVAKDTGKGLAKGALTGLTFGVIEKGIRGLGSGVGRVGTKIQQGVIRPSDADFKNGFSMETIKKYNLGGSLQDTLQKSDAQMEQLSKELNAKLQSSNASINMNNVYQNTTKRLFGDRLTGFGSNTQLSGAAERLRDEILYSSGPNGLVSIPEAQVIKRAAGHYGAWQYGFQDPQAKASERVYNIFYNELKNEIERGSPPGVAEINKKMGELIPVMNAVIKRIPVAERNRGLSFQDIVTLTGAILEPRALAITGLSFAQKSGKVGNILSKATGAGQAVSRGIEGIEKTVRTFQQGGR